MRTTIPCLVPLLAALAGAAALPGLAGCDAKARLAGDYGGKDCGYFKKMSFRSNGDVYLTLIDGQQMPGTFSVDQDKVAVRFAGAGVVFDLKGDELHASMPGLGRMVCRKQ